MAPRHASSEDLAARTFTVEMAIAPGSPLAGQSVADAGLRNLEGVYLVEIAARRPLDHARRTGGSVEAGERLTFAGNVDRIVDLQRVPGLTSAEEPHFAVAGAGAGRQFFEAVVGPASRLAGTTLKAAGFRARYQAAVVAVIRRAGERVGGKLAGEVRLHPGDVLLLLAAG